MITPIRCGLRVRRRFLGQLVNICQNVIDVVFEIAFVAAHARYRGRQSDARHVAIDHPRRDRRVGRRYHQSTRTSDCRVSWNTRIDQTVGIVPFAFAKDAGDALKLCHVVGSMLAMRTRRTYTETVKPRAAAAWNTRIFSSLVKSATMLSVRRWSKSTGGRPRRAASADMTLCTAFAVFHDVPHL